MNNLTEKSKDYFDKYKIDDIINEKSKVLFILESPHTQEMERGYPVAGRSGIDMTRFIYGEEYREPFGKLLSHSDERDPQLENFSILNVSPAPMQGGGLKAYDLDGSDKEVVATLEKLRANYGNQKHKNSNWNLVKEVLVNNFKSRLNHAINNLEQLEYLVPCGRLAQSYLNILKGVGEGLKVIEGIPHPSFNQWSRYNSMERLKEVLDSL